MPVPVTNPGSSDRRTSRPSIARENRRIERGGYADVLRQANVAIRRGLSGGRSTVRDAVKLLPFKSDYQPGIDRLRLQQLADDLEINVAADRVQRRS